MLHPPENVNMNAVEFCEVSVFPRIEFCEVSVFPRIEFCEVSENGLNFPPRQTLDLEGESLDENFKKVEICQSVKDHPKLLKIAKFCFSRNFVCACICGGGSDVKYLGIYFSMNCIRVKCLY